MPDSAESGITQYLNLLYENTDGFVYLATKEPETGTWEQSFFQWPEERARIEEFIVGKGSSTNVYIAPALFSEKSAKKHKVKGSHVYWADFDGALPTQETLADKGIPAPTMRVRSSDETHEHWYWRSETFITDVQDIDGVNRGIAVALGADMSGWDADQVLRPPFTTNHKNNKRVDLTEVNSNRFALETFQQIAADAHVDIEELTEEHVEPLQYIIGRYGFSKYELDRMAPTPKGEKSDRVYELAMLCAEKGLTDKEIFSVLYWADKRIAKFTERNDKVRMYNALVARARAKYPLVRKSLLEFRSASDILNDPVEVEWQIDGLLQRSGLMLLAGSPGVGKSQVTMRFLMAMCTETETFLDFNLNSGPGAYLSLEMPTVELKTLFQIMLKEMTPAQLDLLNKRLLWLDRGEPINFRNKESRMALEHAIVDHGLETVAIDSLSKMGIRKMQDEEAIIEMMEWFDHVRRTYNCSIWIIHHNRKSNSDRKADSMDDVYGSRFLTAGATSVVVMDRNGKKDLAKMKFEKIRMAAERKPLIICRQPHNLDFKVDNEAMRQFIDNVVAEHDEGAASREVDGDFNF